MADDMYILGGNGGNYRVVMHFTFDKIITQTLANTRGQAVKAAQQTARDAADSDIDSIT